MPTRSAAEVMRCDVVTVRPDLSLRELETVLLRERIQGAPVVEGGRVVGVVSRSDVVRQLKLEEERITAASYYLEPFDAEHRAAAEDDRILEGVGARVAKLRVRDVMIEDVVSVAPDATLGEVARCMLERPVHRVFVLEGEELRGVISSLDLVRQLAEGTA